MQSRRHFLKAGLACLAAGKLKLTYPPFSLEGKVMTVRGEIAASQLGFTLPHEHLFSNFGAPPSNAPDYDKDKLIAQGAALP